VFQRPRWYGWIAVSALSLSIDTIRLDAAVTKAEVRFAAILQPAILVRIAAGEHGDRSMRGKLLRDR
jgi:hypothetical protein